MYDGVNYEMYDIDEGVILWDGDSYYLIDSSGDVLSYLGLSIDG